MQLLGALFLLLLAIGLAVAAALLTKQNELSDLKTQSDCEQPKAGKNDCSRATDPRKPKEGDCCGAWLKDFCLRGQVNENLVCVAGGKILPLGLFVAAGVAALLALIVFLMGLRTHREPDYDVAS